MLFINWFWTVVATVVKIERLNFWVSAMFDDSTVLQINLNHHVAYFSHIRCLQRSTSANYSIHKQTKLTPSRYIPRLMKTCKTNRSSIINTWVRLLGLFSMWVCLEQLLHKFSQSLTVCSFLMCVCSRMVRVRFSASVGLESVQDTRYAPCQPCRIS